MFNRKKRMNFKIVDNSRKVVELSRAEQLLINTIRDVKDFDEFVKQVKTMEHGRIRDRLLNVATDKINY